MSSMFVELQTPLNEYSLVCRGCLAESGEMKNITEWGLTEDFCKLTDIVLHSSRGISELLCGNCEDMLLMCKRFISQCQQSDATLRSVAKAKEEEEEELHNSLQDQTNTTNTIKYTYTQEQITYTIIAPNNEAKICLPCPYACKETYIKKKDLLIHLIKQHGVAKDYVVNIKYFCHIQGCVYNERAVKPKYFTIRKALNQHVNKVHRAKIFQCDKCQTCLPTVTDYNRHLKSCNFIFKCNICDKSYNLNERLLVHLMRHHPELHKQYKEAKKAEKRKSKMEPELKKQKTDDKFDYFDSPKRSFATQTLSQTVKNDVTLLSWQNNAGKSDYANEISTQTVFEDLLSLKSQSEDDSLFFSETVSLSDIQTQTFPIEFGDRSHKETLTEPDMSIKETQTCVCVFDSPKPLRVFDSPSNSLGSFTSTETQTQERASVTDVLLSFNSAETQTSFDDHDKLL